LQLACKVGGVGQHLIRRADSAPAPGPVRAARAHARCDLVIPRLYREGASSDSRS